MKNHQACESLRRSASYRMGRLHTALSCVDVLRDYQAFLDGVDRALDQDPSCHIAPDMLAERAYEAEAAMRVLSRHGLDAMNELRDTGRLARVGEWVKSIDGKQLDFEEALRLCRELESDGSGIDLSCLDVLPGLVRQRGLKATARRGRIRLTGRGIQGEEREVAIEMSPHNGSLGRIGRGEFFGARGASGPFATSIPVYSPETCHHRELALDRHRASIVDAYASVLSGMASANQIMYRHARQVEAFGRGGIRGNDPITAIVGAVIVVVGIVLVVVGAAVDSPALIGFGIVTILGGVCIAAGLCSLVVGLLIPVAA